MIRLPAVIAIVAAALIATASWAAIPTEGKLQFGVFRNGDPIGSHTITFSDDGSSVEIRTDVAVKMAFFTVYRFEHSGHEQWAGDRLVALSSTTNDNGTDHSLSVHTADGALVVNGDGAISRADPAILPASLWSEGIVSQRTILNTLHGAQMTIDVTRMDDDAVETPRGPVTARHYSITGDLQRELWYDPNGVLVQVRFLGEDDSTIEYRLQ